MYFNSTVKEIFSLDKKPQAGLVGVEVEVEGFPNNDKVALLKHWMITNDPSLRGAGSREYVLRTPLPRGEAIQATEDLYKAMKWGNKDIPLLGTVKDSMRAGVHVHLNFQESTMRELFTFLALYYSLEVILTDRFGEDRVGNLFCLRNIDASFINPSILAAINLGTYAETFSNDNLRYGACNLTALFKYGSLEFRALKTPTEAGPIVDWINILCQLKEVASRFRNPQDVLSFFSESGGEQLLKQVLPKEEADQLIWNEDYEEKLHLGIRAIQFWVFVTNWE